MEWWSDGEDEDDDGVTSGKLRWRCDDDDVVMVWWREMVSLAQNKVYVAQASAPYFTGSI